MSIFLLPEEQMVNKRYYLENRLSYHTFWPSTHQNLSSSFVILRNIEKTYIEDRNRPTSTNSKLAYDAMRVLLLPKGRMLSM